MRIDQIWKELEEDSTFFYGLLLKRYAGSILPDIYVALKGPEKFRCLAASLNTDVKVDIERFSNLTGARIELIPDPENPYKKMLILVLLDFRYKDIFSVLCEDLIVNVGFITTESGLVKELINRFERWESLFGRAGLQGLSALEQRGLFGEMILLKKLLGRTSNYIHVLNAWVGCEGALRDFHMSTWGIEVKTTLGNNHQRIHISSERQLDPSNLEDLFLFHVSLEIIQNSGESLNSLVRTIRQTLESDFRALNKFNAKLAEGNYFDHHQDLYDEIGYAVREETFYKVFKNFPRIEEKDIRAGVGEIRYSIIVSDMSEYQRTESEIFQILKLNE